MTSGPHQHACKATGTSLTGVRAALGLALKSSGNPGLPLNVHAILNLLNRCVASEDSGFRDELVSRLADYLVASSRVLESEVFTLSGLWTLARSYAGMRYFVADAIEPRVDCPAPASSLRTRQGPDMVRFVQSGIDSLLPHYTPSVTLQLNRLAPWKAELVLTAAMTPAESSMRIPPGWELAGVEPGLRRSCCFTAVVDSRHPA